MPSIYRYQFGPAVPMDEVEGSLLLSTWAAAALHGGPETRLNAGYAVDADVRSCVVDASSPPGRDLNKIFLALVEREFGPDAFEVSPVGPQEAASALREA